MPNWSLHLRVQACKVSNLLHVIPKQARFCDVETTLLPFLELSPVPPVAPADPEAPAPVDGSSAASGMGISSAYTIVMNTNKVTKSKI